MATKKDIVIAVLITFCLATTLFWIVPSNSTPSQPYDPMFDWNGDGKIGPADYAYFSIIFGANGTYVNVTASILELQAKIDTLNASLATLESKVNNSTIPYNSTYIYSDATTETIGWADIPYLNVSITLKKTGCLLIMFSTDANAIREAMSSNAALLVRALIDDTQYPFPGSGGITLTPALENTGFLGLSDHSHSLDIGSFSYNFYTPNVSPGTHTVKMQFKVTRGTGYLYYSTLTVIALPTQ
jgi:hypothetical protein